MSKLLMVDIETVAIPGVERFLGAIEAPANYTKPEAIAAYIEKATAKERDLAALDPDLARVVAIGFQLEGERAPLGAIAKDEEEEARVLDRFWAYYRKASADNSFGGVKLCGFNVAGFDVPVLLRRSLYLRVPAPEFRLGRFAYQHPQIVDLQDACTMDGHSAFKWRSKDWWIKRMGLAGSEDAHTGADVAALVATGQWDAVLHHAKADVTKEIQMAQWLGIWSAE
jgi:predicted PolB exonuclease-like 3'-5' exonuclease